MRKLLSVIQEPIILVLVIKEQTKLIWGILTVVLRYILPRLMAFLKQMGHISLTVMEQKIIHRMVSFQTQPRIPQQELQP